MAEGLIRFLGRDLREALQAGARRTPLDPPGGAAWLSRWAWVSLIVGLTLFAACGYHAGFERLNGLAGASPPWVWQWLTVLGDERVPFALSLFFALRYPRVFWALILAALVASAYSRGLKPLFDATRPPGILPADAFNLIGPGHRRVSFPSGHSVTAGVFFGVLVYYARRVESRVLLLLLGVLAGLSRVAVGVHWPVDVAAGLFGGVLAAWAGARLAARWQVVATDASVHLAFVTLACFLTLTLTYWDGGYRDAATLLRLLGVAALISAAAGYLILPLARWVRVSVPGGPAATRPRPPGPRPPPRKRD